MNRVKVLFLMILGGVLLASITLRVQASEPKPFHSQAFAAPPVSWFQVPV